LQWQKVHFANGAQWVAAIVGHQLEAARSGLKIFITAVSETARKFRKVCITRAAGGQMVHFTIQSLTMRILAGCAPLQCLQTAAGAAATALEAAAAIREQGVDGLEMTKPAFPCTLLAKNQHLRTLTTD